MLVSAALMSIHILGELLRRLRFNLKITGNIGGDRTQREVLADLGLPMIALFIAFLALAVLASEIVMEAVRGPEAKPLLQTAAGPETTANSELPDPAEEQIKAALLSLYAADEAGDVEAVLAHYAEDAILYPPGRHPG